MKKTRITAIGLALLALLVLYALLTTTLSSCGGKVSPKGYADGVYTGRSSDHGDDEDGHGAGYGTVEVTVKDGKVADCAFVLYELDGTVKDETYGAGMTKENRLKAQKAVQSAAKYASMLAEGGSAAGVDVISGATISYHEFLEAVDDALAKAAVA